MLCCLIKTLLKSCNLKALWPFIWCCFFPTAALQAKETLRMAMPDYPPYTYVQNGGDHGFGYEAFVSIMADLQYDF